MTTAQLPLKWLVNLKVNGCEPTEVTKKELAANPGNQDITVNVALDQLPGGFLANSQAEFLTSHGIKELVKEGRRIWEKQAHLGGLEAVKARSRITEAKALLDPNGLGGFTTLEWLISH